MRRRAQPDAEQLRALADRPVALEHWNDGIDEPSWFQQNIGKEAPPWMRLEETPSLAKIYGKRIIVMGGGAQVGQVAMGAIAEADRHNIRGERISVDTIGLVGEHFEHPAPEGRPGSAGCDRRRTTASSRRWGTSSPSRRSGTAG